MTTAGAKVGGLRREVGRVGMLAASLGAVIGSGWLFAPMAAASTAGPASVVSWLLGGCMVTLIALLVGELGSAYPVAGYVIRCPSLAFGPVIGFIAGWVSWLATTAGIAIMVTVCLIYFNAQVDGFATTSGAAPLLTLLGVLVAVVIIALFTVVNLLGVKLTTRINIFVVAVKIAIPVALVIGLLTTSFNGNNFIEFAPFGVQGVVEALPLGVVFSLLGFDQAVNLAGEARNPGRAIPRTVLGAVGITTGLYVLLQIAFIGALPAGSTAGGWATAGSGDNATFVTFTAVLGLTGLAAVVYVNALISPVETGFVLSLALRVRVS